MATAVATRRQGYTHDLEIGPHRLVADEPESVGGNDEGPSPTKLLAGALASCTAITVEMYANRKGWALPELRVLVDLGGHHSKGTAVYDVTLELPEGLDPDQVDRITTIAGKCPVHRALARETEITVTASGAGAR